MFEWTIRLGEYTFQQTVEVSRDHRPGREFGQGQHRTLQLTLI